MKKIMMLLVAMFYSGAMVRAQGPVAAYAFNEGSGTTSADASGNNNTVTLGAPSWNTSGKFGGSLAFNGNAKAIVVNSVSLQLTTGMTLEAWVYPTVIGSSWRDVIMKGQDDYYLEATSSNSAKVATGGTFTTFLSGGSILPVNVWSHIATTYNGSTVILYINGVSVATKAQTGSIHTSTNELQIGGDRFWPGGQYFTGRIDEVRIYNRALTAVEIQADMVTAISAVTPPTPPPPPPVPGITSFDKNPDAPVSLDFTYDSNFQPQISGFSLYASDTSTGPWTFYGGISDPTKRTYSFIAPDKSTYFTLDACKQTSSTAGNCSAKSNVILIRCIPLTETYLWQTYTTRSCR